MGSNCCSGSKSIDLEPLKKGSVLYAAQQMKTTKNGEPINMIIMRKPMSELEAVKSQTDPSLSEDMRTIFNPPFNVCHKLTKHVYLGGIASLTHEKLQNLKINLIINATFNWPKVCPIIDGKEVVNIRVPVDDSAEDDISIYFDEVSDKIEENVDKGGHTLIHCMAGASRSTTLVLAYLMKYENISLLNAFKSVKKRRESGRPNIGFWEQLIRYEIRTRGKSSTKMITENKDGIEVKVPDFYKTLYPDLYNWEIDKQVKQTIDKRKNADKPKGQKVSNPVTKKFE